MGSPLQTAPRSLDQASEHVQTDSDENKRSPSPSCGHVGHRDFCTGAGGLWILSGAEARADRRRRRDQVLGLHAVARRPELPRPERRRRYPNQLQFRDRSPVARFPVRPERVLKIAAWRRAGEGIDIREPQARDGEARCVHAQARLVDVPRPDHHPALAEPRPRRRVRRTRGVHRGATVIDAVARVQRGGGGVRLPRSGKARRGEAGSRSVTEDLDLGDS